MKLKVDRDAKMHKLGTFTCTLQCGEVTKTETTKHRRIKVPVESVFKSLSYFSQNRFTFIFFVIEAQTVRLISTLKTEKGALEFRLFAIQIKSFDFKRKCEQKNTDVFFRCICV